MAVRPPWKLHDFHGLLDDGMLQFRLGCCPRTELLCLRSLFQFREAGDVVVGLPAIRMAGTVTLRWQPRCVFPKASR